MNEHDTPAYLRQLDATIADAETHTLTCVSCGTRFERPHHRGPAPKFCQGCGTPRERQRDYTARAYARSLWLLAEARWYCEAWCLHTITQSREPWPYTPDHRYFPWEDGQ
jgi:hypothetical protein